MTTYRHHICPNKQNIRLVKWSVRIWFLNLDVQSEGSPTAVTEITGRDMICGAVLVYVACRDPSMCTALRGVVTACCVSILSYIYRTQLWRSPQIREGRGKARISCWIIAIALHPTTQSAVRCAVGKLFGTEFMFSHIFGRWPAVCAVFGSGKLQLHLLSLLQTHNIKLKYYFA